MELSLAGIVGAAVGTMVSAFIYVPIGGAIERTLRGGRPRSEETEGFELELALLKRAILAVDMVACAALGYWIGLKVGG
jgi:hypothetical protein